MKFEMEHLREFYNFIIFREFVYSDKNPISFRRMDSVSEKSGYNLFPVNN